MVLLSYGCEPLCAMPYALHSWCRQSDVAPGKVRWQEHNFHCSEKSAMLIWSEGSLCVWVKDPESVGGWSTALLSLVLSSLAKALPRKRVMTLIQP